MFKILTIDLGEHWNVAVEKSTSWTVLSNFLQVVDQILFTDWLVEQVREHKNGINTELLSVLGQVVNFGNGCATDLSDAVQLVFTACLEPFFDDALAFLETQGGALTGGAVNQDGGDSLLFQELSVLVDDVVVDVTFPEQIK